MQQLIAWGLSRKLLGYEHGCLTPYRFSSEAKHAARALREMLTASCALTEEELLQLIDSGDR